MDSLFKQAWAALNENDENRPRRWRSYVKLPWAEVKQKAEQQDPEFVKYIVNGLFSGDVFILQNAYEPEFFEDLKKRCFAWGKSVPQSFHKMLEDTPDFHRIIDAEVSKNYKVEHIRHTYYFYPWNKDPLGIMKDIYARWRILKLIGGYDADEYERNTPKDGVVDRVIIAQYPHGSGEIKTHSDPFKYQRYIMGAKMSTRGVDYKEGGLYFVDREGREIDIEDTIELGDIYISYATVLHGVKAIDPGADLNWESISGRWFLGLYSNNSDVVKDRHTVYEVDKGSYHNVRV